MNIDIEKLEKLSNLKVENKEQMAEQLGAIIEYVENLNELDTQEVESTFSTLNGGTPVREDIVKKSDVSAHVLAHAPNAEDDFFIVPSIIE
jgi:aspartyl-tRNA(Asn)/glutamyl-tRNA(Gln) amidotransferase subunit C